MVIVAPLAPPFANPSVPAVVAFLPNTGAAVYAGAAELLPLFPRTLPAPALARLAVTVPEEVTALDGVELKTVPSPVKVTLVTLPPLIAEMTPPDMSIVDPSGLT